MNEGMTKARAVLDIFRAAGLRTPFGFDQDAAEELWGVKIGLFDLAAVLEAANQWVSTQTEFPTIAEFEVIAGQLHRNGDVYRKSGYCIECGSGGAGEVPEGWVYRSNPLEPGVPTVRPCSLCRPDLHRLWLAGHFKPTGVTACSCGDPACRFTKKH